MGWLLFQTLEIQPRRYRPCPQQAYMLVGETHVTLGSNECSGEEAGVKMTERQVRLQGAGDRRGPLR